MRGLLLLLVSSSASAQLLLEEPFSARPADAGWTPVVQPVAGIADLSAGRLGNGWRVNHPDAGSGVANRSPCFRKGFDAGVGVVTARYWLNASSTNDEFGMFPVILQSPMNTLAEVRFAGATLGAMTPILQCADAMGFHVCSNPNPTLLDAQVWHLIELRLEGTGTPQGRCRAAVDGSEFCSQIMTWGGIQPTSAFIGLCAVDEAWAGTMTVDELRVASTAQGSRLRINGPDAGNEGDCLRFTIDTIDAFTQQPAPVAVSTPLESVTFTGATGFFASDCATTSLAPVLSPNAPVWEVYARAGRIDVGLTASSSDLLPPVALTVRITPAPDASVALDAGVSADAGVFDAGTSGDAGALDAGAPTADAGSFDGGAFAMDAGATSADAGSFDAGVPTTDAGVNDAGATPTDAGQTDAGSSVSDAGFTGRPVDYDIGCGCTGAPLLQFVAALALLLRRSRR